MIEALDVVWEIVMRKKTRFIVGTAAIFLAVAMNCEARADCYGSTQRLSSTIIAQFAANPARLLGKYPDGGVGLISTTRDLVASSQKLLPLILDLVPKANAAQLEAIGTGLGQAALTCVQTDQAFANEIQQMVVALNNDKLALAFEAVLGDENLAAVNSGGGGGDDGPTGQGQTGAGVAGAGNTSTFITSFPTRPDSFNVLSDVGSKPGTTNVTNQSVSPSTPF